MRFNVLVADSDALLLSAYETFLSAEGARVTTATSGLDCLAALRKSRPDLLIIDSELPWGSGLGVLAVMREEPALRDVPVLVLATLSCAMLAEANPLAPGYAVLLKPVSPAELARLVSSISAWDRRPDAPVLVSREAAYSAS